MNRGRPRRLAALTALCVLAVTLLATGCSAATPGGSPVLAAAKSLHRAGTAQPAAPAVSGLAGCTALLGAHQAPAKDYREIRSQFAHSRWPDLRAAGMSYVDLVVRLQAARADGYETVWLSQRLSLACVRHGWDHLVLRPIFGHVGYSRDATQPSIRETATEGTTRT
jgi:hypothetical protein